MHHAAAVAASLEDLPVAQPVILVGHSGAGPFLPAARTRINRAVAGYIFVDASLAGPDGASRLDLFESRETAELFRGRAKDGLLPTWTELFVLTDEDVCQVIPDEALREQFIAELRPLPLAVYEEPLPVFPGWPDAPCGYLKFSPAYDPAAEQARKAGWPCVDVANGHFQMLAAPDTVAEVLVRLAAEMGALAAGN